MGYETALVTGASSGLGYALAEALARQGTRVVAAARRRELLDALQARASTFGGVILPLELDLMDTVATVSRLREVDEREGGIHLVVANAGIGVRVSGKRMTFESIEAMLKVNYVGAIATLTALLPAMVARGRGHLVGISSLASFRGLPGHAAYCSSKAGLSTFLESLSYDLAGTGVDVTTVHPGFIKTPMTASNKHPMPQILTPEEAAERIVHALERRPSRVDFPFAVAAVSRLVSTIPSSLMGPLLPLLKPAGRKHPPQDDDAVR